ncbi:unnamed protein product, partial [Vitis vinifera]
MAISSSLLAKAESDSFLRGIDSTTSSFEADISKGGPTCGHAHACFHSCILGSNMCILTSRMGPNG